MMATTTPTVGVFLSYAARDSWIADIVRRELSDSGFAVFDASQRIPPGSNFGDVLRAELAESDAVLVIAQQGGLLPSSVAFEVGAASAWHKPVFVVTDKPGTLDLPSFLQSHRVFPLARLDELARTLKDAAEPLSDHEIAALIDAYQSFAVPVDQLIGDPTRLHSFSGEFNKRIERPQSDARLMQNLLRLRKRGVLPKLGRK
jgi:hypothetical protein